MEQATTLIEPTERTAVRRRGGRASYERTVVNSILDEGLVGHVGICDSGGQPYVIPMIYARDGDQVYLHGSPLSRLITTVTRGVPVCLTVTLLDGVVLARSAFHHSMNYRSVVVLGQAQAVEDEAEQRAALQVIVEHVAAGRSGDVRGPSEQELAATSIARLPLLEASAKIRSGPPVDAAEDYSLPVWAGVVPLYMQAGSPIPDPRCEAGVPAYARDYNRDAISSAA